MKGQFINTAFLNTVGLLQIYLVRVLGDKYLGCFQEYSERIQRQDRNKY